MEFPTTSTAGHGRPSSAANDLAYLTATELLRRLGTGAVSSAQLVEAQLTRIEQLDPVLHALVTVDAAGARREAAACDAERRDGRLRGVLHGLPITIKDAFATAGLRTTAGMEERADHVPDRDALAVARLRSAGAIIVGKTSCPEGATGQETGSALLGTTRNPFDTSRTTGGSSGGAAAALAAGLTPLELGSDLGGSIRQPAAFCGVFGHYPTHGIVPPRGHLSSLAADDLEAQKDLLTVGPMARSTQDLELALGVLAGPDAISARGWDLRLPAPTVQEPGQLRAAVWLDDEDFPVDGEVRGALAAASDALEARGADVDRSARPPLRLLDAERLGFDLWVAASSASMSDADVAEQRAAAEAAVPDDRGRRARRARAATMSHRDWIHLDARRRELQRTWESFFADVDVLICPVVPVVAYPVDDRPEEVADLDHRLERTIEVDGRPRPYLDQLVWTTAIGLARLPSTTVPVGRSRQGLPVGAQVVGASFTDRTTLRVGGWLADAAGGFRAPPL